MPDDSGSEAEQNRGIALRFLVGLVTADRETVALLMHDDFRYWLGGNMPASGWHDRDGFFRTTQVLADVVAGPPSMKLGDVVAEGDRVLIEAESDIPLANGTRYNNYYVMAMRVADGKVLELKEYADTLHTYQVIDHQDTRGPSKDRESPLTYVTRQIRPS